MASTRPPWCTGGASRTPGSPEAAPTSSSRNSPARRTASCSARRSSTTTSCTPATTSSSASLTQHIHATTTVPFTYIGITKEFPTAPKDAYTIANRAYIAHATGDPATATVLLQTSGASPTSVGALVARRIGRSGTVTTIGSSRKAIASSLTSVELAGLTRVELAYALVLLAAATGLLLWLSLAERRRTYAIAHALGARPRQLAGFVWPETGFVTITGVVLGAAGAAWLTWMLVKLLTGVFDPPPYTTRRAVAVPRHAGDRRGGRGRRRRPRHAPRTPHPRHRDAP